MPADSPQLTSGRGWIVVGLALLLGLLNYFDRVVISFAIEPIKDEFHLTNAGFGFAMSLFALGTLAINGISGVLLDRFGVRVVWLVGLAVWSLAMLMLGMVHLWWLFLAFRVLLGLGEGVNFPAMNRAIGDWIPKHQASKAAAIALVGVPGALLLGGPLFSVLVQDEGWRGTFVILGIGGGVMFVLWLLLYRNPAHVADGPKLTRRQWLELLKDRTLLATSWSFFAFGAILFFGVTWIPGYFRQEWKLDLMKIGWFTTLPWALSIVGMVLIGALSDRLFHRSGSVRLARVHPIWILQLLAALSFVPLVFVDSAGWAIFWLTIAIGLSMSANGPYYSICTDLFPHGAGAATGIMVTFFSASGVVVPYVVGWLTDQFQGKFAAAFFMLAAIVASGALGMLLFARPGRVLTNDNEKVLS